MNFDPSQLPSELFDCMQSHPFKELDFAKQQWVIHFLTEEEYDAMHLGHKLTQMQAELHNRESAIKSDLIQRVEKLAPASTSMVATRNRSFIWQAASILLLFSTAWFGYKSMTPHIQVETKTVVSRDTIYIETESKKKEDNIAKETTSSVKRKQNNLHKTGKATRPKYKPNTMEAVASSPMKKNIMLSESGIPVLSLDKINDSPNKTKRNSKRHEPLEEQFKFVSL